jgi:hypothetical protein
MPTNLRSRLTIRSIGFAIEGAEELYSLTTPGASSPGASIWFVAPAILTLIGILFVWIGRHEYTEVHARRAERASLIFGLSLVGGVVTALLLGLLVSYPSIGTPLWAEVLFGAALASLLFGTFVSYAYLVFHLVATPSKIALLAAVMWALLISAFITISLASDLPTVIGLIQARNFSVPSFLSPVDTLVSYLFLSYFLLLAAYVEAHVAIARGRATSAGRNPPPPKPETTA